MARIVQSVLRATAGVGSWHMGRAHYVTLDAMRGVAAIAVVLYHARDLFPIDARSGYLAVDFFFVLSGFVVAHAYGHRLEHGMTFVQFFKKRLLRFYPLYFAGLLIGVASVLYRGVLTPTEASVGFGAGLLFMPSPMPGEPRLAYSLNSPSWSLFWELAINLAFAAFYARLSKRVLIGAMAIGAVSLIVAALFYGRLNLGFRLEHFWVGGARVLFSFPAGVLLYHYRDRIPAIFGRAGSWAPLAALAVLLVLPVPEPLRPMYDLGFIFALSPLLVAAGTTVQPGRVSAAPFKFLGAISFAIYAIHYPLVPMAVGLAEESGASPLLVGIAFICGILVLSWLADRADVWIRSKFQEPRSRAVQAHTA